MEGFELQNFGPRKKYPPPSHQIRSYPRIEITRCETIDQNTWQPPRRERRVLQFKPENREPENREHEDKACCCIIS